MVLSDILRNIGIALDWIKRYINGDISFDPRNILNRIQISLITIRKHMQRHTKNAINSQGLLNTTDRWIYNIMNELTNIRNDLF